MHKPLHSLLNFDRNDIEPARNVVQLLFSNIALSGSPNEFLLRRRDCFLRQTEPAVAAQLHFDKHQIVSVFCDNINLAMVKGIVPVKDGKSLPP